MQKVLCLSVSRDPLESRLALRCLGRYRLELDDSPGLVDLVLLVCGTRLCDLLLDVGTLGPQVLQLAHLRVLLLCLLDRVTHVLYIDCS